MKRAALPMYDLPELRPATDRLWATLAADLRQQGVLDVPPTLSRDHSPDALWIDPDLLLSQTCGYPLTHALRDRVSVVATPVYDVPGCEGHRYSSFVVVSTRAKAKELADLRGAICAVNDRSSHSGANALRALIAPHSRQGHFFGSVQITGSHHASLAAVAHGQADVAAIDCVTHALLASTQPSLIAKTRILATTRLAPALPYITRGAALRSVLRVALCRVPDEILAPLRIRRFEILPESIYDEVLQMERDAEQHGCFALS
jgi:ABC-type phosphate/phosphonate transport system substrate-binding protein